MDLGGTGLGERVEDLLALAAAALGRGDWADARDAYQRALAAGEDAATLEGLAYACWWLRDDAVTVDSRRKAFRLYLDAGDTVSAARVAISLARDHILQGERSVANGWLGRAERLLAEAAGSGSSRPTSRCTPTATRPRHAGTPRTPSRSARRLGAGRWRCSPSPTRASRWSATGW
jgi:hypothetical protein